MLQSDNCQCCTKEKPGYNVFCIDCCVRLVVSARPSKYHQERMFEFIERHKNAPNREIIHDHLKHTN